MSMTNCDIQKKLEEFLSSYSVDYPLDIFDLAEHAGYDVLRFHPSKDAELPKISGALVYEKKRIFINGDEPLNRRRFTCAHELGHAVLHHQDVVDKKIAFRIDGESNDMEIEANNFAAALLMPEQYLREVYSAFSRDMPITMRIEELAKYFQVSTQAMFYRLQNIGLIRQE